MNRRTIISALYPRRYQDSYTEVYLTAWFEELDGPVEFLASPFDCERHGKELWIRSMAGEYGPIEVIDEPSPITMRLENARRAQLEAREAPKLLEYRQ